VIPSAIAFIHYLVHVLDQSIDQIFTVSIVSTFDEMCSLLSHATEGAAELEGPKELVDFLEVGSYGVYFVDKILNTDNTLSTEVLLNELVVGERKTLSSNLSETSLVDKLSHALKVGVTTYNICKNKSHIDKER
jgi:hypothetical protein